MDILIQDCISNQQLSGNCYWSATYWLENDFEDHGRIIRLQDEAARLSKQARVELWLLIDRAAWVRWAHQYGEKARDNILTEDEKVNRLIGELGIKHPPVATPKSDIVMEYLRLKGIEPFQPEDRGVLKVEDE